MTQELYEQFSEGMFGLKKSPPYRTAKNDNNSKPDDGRGV